MLSRCPQNAQEDSAAGHKHSNRTPKAFTLLEARRQLLHADQPAGLLGKSLLCLLCLVVPTSADLQTEEERREHEACQAGMQRLPAGVQPQVACQPAGVCHVCHVEDYSDDNLLLEVSDSAASLKD